MYEVLAYTGQWAHRRLYFNNLSAAKRYAESELESEDVVDVWITTIDITRTTSFGACVIIENKSIL